MVQGKQQCQAACTVAVPAKGGSHLASVDADQATPSRLSPVSHALVVPAHLWG